MRATREWRRLGAASATLSAGALVFFAGAGPAYAAASPSPKAGKCKLGPLCSILDGGQGHPAKPPSNPKPKPKPKPVKPAAPKHHASTHGSSHSHTSSSSSTSSTPNLPHTSSRQRPQVAPQARDQSPALPDISPQAPAVFPQAAPERQQAQLMASDSPAVTNQTSPLVVATASGAVGFVAALNLSVLNRRLRRPRP